MKALTRLSSQYSWILAALMLLASACGTSASGRSNSARPSDVVLVERAAWAEVFESYDATGTFAMQRLNSDKVLVHDPDRARAQFLPASTFKIVSSLIALETGVVADVEEFVQWDGVERPIEAWNRDHSLRTGIEVSAVWMYQHLARDIGEDRMSSLVAEANYGNTDIGGLIDEFWLNGDLRISALEQLDMLTDLMTDKLPFDHAHQAAVRDILVRESDTGSIWAHKTGTALGPNPVLGWLVGYTEFDGATWVFAMNIDLGDSVELYTQIDPQIRQKLANEILRGEGALRR